MKRQKMGFDKKMTIVLLIVGICIIGYFAVFLFINRSEGDPAFIFYEVSVNETLNRSVIQLEDKDIMNIKGLDVKQKDGKITMIYFRYSSTTPEISDEEFNAKYGSNPDKSLIQYLEYRGVYYYARERFS
jgi:hypothetical protein